MLEKLKKISDTKFQRVNFKAFFFFLTFSFLIWILVQFSKKYEENIKVPVVYTTIPKDKIISKQPIFLELKLRENGFKIAWVSLFQKEFKIDLSKLQIVHDSLIFNIENNTKKIRANLGLNLEDVVFLDDVLRIGFQFKEVRKVPVKAQMNIEFKPGFASQDSLKITPDSIKISGSKKKVDAIHAIKTKLINLKNVDQSLTGKIPFDTTGIGDITLYQKAANYTLEVEKFTEGKIDVPIFVINAPKDMEVIIFPKNLKVVFKVSLKNFDKVSKNDFRVVCDYEDLKGEQDFFIPKIVEKPHFITNLRLNINKVQFVVKK